MSAPLQNQGSSALGTGDTPSGGVSLESTRRNEAFLAAAQRLSHTGSFGWKIPSGDVYWSAETFRIYEYDPATGPTLDLVFQRVHPEDARMLRATIDRITRDRDDFDFEFRLLMPDGRVKHLRAIAHPEPLDDGGIEFVGAVMDITAAK